MASRSLSLSKLLVEPRVRIDYYVNKIRVVGLGWTVRWIARQYPPAPFDQGPATYYSVLAAWGDRPPLLALDEAHRTRGRAVLAEMGVPSDAWFVAIHAREAGFSVENEAAQAFRNSDILRLIPAIREVRRRGGWVVRMGD